MNKKISCFQSETGYFLLGFALHVLGHYLCNVLRAATLFGVVLFALAAGAGTGHTADIGESFSTLLHSLNNLALGNMVAVTYQFMVLHISISFREVLILYNRFHEFTICLP